MRLEGVRVVGDPNEYARRYDREGIDELFYLDVVASLYGRNSLGGLLARTADRCFVPITAAGGVRCSDGVRSLLRSGADKIAVNTAAVEHPALIDEIATAIGSANLTVQIDAKAKNGHWEAYTDGGREPSGRDAVAWASEAVSRGAGEILLTSIDREGTGQGFDLKLIDALAGVVSVPVVASGGFGAAHHAVEAALAGASGIAIAGALHYGRVSLDGIRDALWEAGIPVRRADS